METNGPKIIISLWAMTIVSVVFMVLRFWVKYRFSKLFGWDDYLLALSWVLVLGYTVFIEISVDYGIGRHFVDTDKVEIVSGIKYMYIGEIFALVAMPTSKTSFCVTLLRLTPNVWHKVFLWFVIITINGTLWACAIMTLAQCDPVEKLWDMGLPGKCWDNRIVIDYSVFVGVWSCLLDFLLTCVPWLIIGKLQMNAKEKFGLIITMSLGCLAGVTCAVKTAYIPSIGTWQDFTYNTADVLIWGLSETAITIVAASMPFLRILVREVSTKGASGGYRLEDRSSNFKTIGSARTHPRSTSTGRKGDGDGDSDISILGESNMNSGAIVKTDEVTLEYGPRDDNSIRRDNGRYN